MFRHLGERVGDPLPSTVPISELRPKVSPAKRRNAVHKQYSTRSSQNEKKSRELNATEVNEKKKWWVGRNGEERIYSTNIGSTGLRNIGNSCYINTTIQALSSVPQFIEKVLNRTYKSSDQEAGMLTDELGSLVRDLKSGKYKYTSCAAH